MVEDSGDTLAGSEYYTGEELDMLSLLSDLGLAADVRMWMDANAAKAIALGLGNDKGNRVEIPLTH